MAQFHSLPREHQPAGKCWMVEHYEDDVYVDAEYGDHQYFRGWFRSRSALTKADAVAYARNLATKSGQPTRIVRCDKCADHDALWQIAGLLA